MPTDLQAALKRWEGWELGDPFDSGTLDVILDAARLVADPNYEAAWLAWKRYNPWWMSRRLKLRLRTPIKWIVAAALTPGDPK